jgi:hypothetical protein
VIAAWRTKAAESVYVKRYWELVARRRLLHRLFKTLITILLTILIGKVLEYLFHGFGLFLEKADSFVEDGVTNGQPFHFYAEYYRQFVHYAFSQPHGNLGTIIAALFTGFLGAIAKIMQEGLAAIVTMVIVLFIGIAITYDRKNEHPIFVALIVGPLVGGCVLYLVMALMWTAGLILGAGAKALTFIGSTVPLVKQGAAVLMESQSEKMAERVVDQVSHGGKS